MNIDDAYAICRSIAHRHGANFSVGFRFLPRQKRRAVYAAYAFCRAVDDVADDVEPALSALEPTETRLDDWQGELDRCYDGRPTHAIGIALADSLRSFAIPKAAFVALIDGCRQDLRKNRYDNFDELLDYCRMVALSIADISLAIFGYRSPAAIDYGRKLATALQLTNVTRDIGDDLTRDRVYLPQDELCRFGVTRFGETPEMRRLVEFQIDRAESYFRAAEPLIDELSFDARFPVLLMGGIYANVLKRLRRDPLVVLRKRLTLSKLEKSAVVFARLLRPRFVS
ncbi:MAG TPA: squalene/phytoene synthase family protein [Thermoanaerobaculia bacterium]|nr:squalene/phytoene synthase family protein [Thermoanaerobaculia bacterium]